MERVQFQQEQMLSELKDLAQKGVFTQAELKQIMKKRTAFETALVRRVPRKGDFLRYAAYEMSLEALRRKRAERLKIPKGPPSVSDYALVRRQFQIFERALKKFKEDVGLWVQYLQVAKREGARALVGRISARALQLHPNSTSLYILAASHELSHMSHSAARILLQRGIRLNPESIDLWREYLKMELGFVESLRRRWEVLGLDTMPSGGSAEQHEGITDAVDTAMADADDGGKARNEVLQGALAKAVITSAVKAKPSSELFSALHSVLISYPCPVTLRKCLLEHLHNHLQSTLSLDTDPLATKLCATWFLTSELIGSELVDAIKGANEELSHRLRRAQDISKGNLKGRTFMLDMAEVYSSFVREWFEKDIDDNLKLYLLTSLQALCVSCKAERLLLAHLRLISSSHNPQPLSSEKLLKLAKKYSSKAATSYELWLFRLNLEWVEKDENWHVSAKEARQHVLASVEDDSARCAVWEWALDRKPLRPPHELLQMTEGLLHEASSTSSSKMLMDRLLVRYIRSLREQSSHLIARGEYHQRGTQVKEISRLANLFPLSPNVWEAAFDIYSTQAPSFSLPPPPTDSTIESPTAFSMDVDIEDETETILRTIYNKWRLVSPSVHGDAALKWAGWLSKHRKGSEAAEVVAFARAAIISVDTSAVDAFERQWGDILNNVGEKEGQDEQDDDKLLLCSLILDGPYNIALWHQEDNDLDRHDMYTCEIPVVGKSITGSEVVADAAEREKKLLRKSQLHLFSMEQKLVIASEGEYRAPGLLERYYIARSCLGFDSCVVVGAKYIGPAGEPLSKRILYPALSQVVRKHAALSASIEGAKSSAVSIARLPLLDLNTVVEFPDVSFENDALNNAFLEGQFQRPIVPAPGRPLWRVAVTSDNFVFFSWNHIIGDGLSGLAFLRALVNALNALQRPASTGLDEPPEETIAFPDNISLLPPLEKLTDLSVSTKTLLHAVAGILIPRSWYESKSWSGNKVAREARLSIKTNVRSVHLPSETTARLLSLSKNHGATLTSTIYVACICVLSSLIQEGSNDQTSPKGRSQKFTCVGTSVAVSLRPVAKVAPDAFGNVISTFISSERLHPWKAENTSTFPWDFAASYTKKLHNSIPRTRETIGSLKYLFGNYDGFFLSKLGKKRQMGIELSNLGAFTVNVGDNGDSGAKTSWTIGGTYFAQDDRIVGSALKVTVAGSPDGSLGIAFSWGDGSVDDVLAEAFVRDVMALISNIQ